MNLKFRTVFLPAVVFFLCAFAAAPSRSLGNQAPDFTLPAFGVSSPVTLSVLNKENPVLLVFWATWCPTCREEMPELNKWQETKTPKGLKILAVNVEEPRRDVEKFIKQKGLKYPVAFDIEGKIANEYGLVGIPVVIYLEKGGEVLYYGYQLPQNIDALLEQRRS